MRMNDKAAWIFHSPRAFDITHHVPERFKTAKKIDTAFLTDLFTALIVEMRVSEFMAMGLAESLRRAEIKDCSAVVVDGVEYIPARVVVMGNGFSFAWVK